MLRSIVSRQKNPKMVTRHAQSQKTKICLAPEHSCISVKYSSFMDEVTILNVYGLPIDTSSIRIGKECLAGIN